MPDGEREAARGERAIGGALHARVGGALQGLVERAGAGGDEADAEEHVEQAALQGGDAGLHRAQIEAAPAGDEDQADDFDFEELAEVVDERWRWRRGCGRVQVRAACVGCVADARVAGAAVWEAGVMGMKKELSAARARRGGLDSMIASGGGQDRSAAISDGRCTGESRVRMIRFF